MFAKIAILFAALVAVQASGLIGPYGLGPYGLGPYSAALVQDKIYGAPALITESVVVDPATVSTQKAAINHIAPASPVHSAAPISYATPAALRYAGHGHLGNGLLGAGLIGGHGVAPAPLVYGAPLGLGLGHGHGVSKVIY